VLDIDKIFPFLPIERVKLSSNITKAKKWKIPFPNRNGVILSARFKNRSLGIQRGKKFSNSINLDMSTHDRVVSMKLSKSTIQMCGSIYRHQVNSIVDSLFKHLYFIREMLLFAQTNPIETENTIKWITEICKGKLIWVLKNTDSIIDISRVKEMPTLSNLSLHLPNNNDEGTIDKDTSSEMSENDTVSSNFSLSTKHVIINGENKRIEQVHQLVFPDEYVTKRYPSNVNARLADYLLGMISDYNRYDCYCKHIWSISELSPDIIPSTLNILKTGSVNVNYNYDLGFYINREKLVKIIDDWVTTSGNAFQSRYENVIEHAVTIKLPFDLSEKMSQEVWPRDKLPWHNFIVYRTGRVTQSSPHEELACEAYYQFRRAISNFYQTIQIPFPVKTVKIPTNYNSQTRKFEQTIRKSMNVREIKFPPNYDINKIVELSKLRRQYRLQLEQQLTNCK
jgi:hypothetical protein